MDNWLQVGDRFRVTNSNSPHYHLTGKVLWIPTNTGILSVSLDKTGDLIWMLSRYDLEKVDWRSLIPSSETRFTLVSRTPNTVLPEGGWYGVENPTTGEAPKLNSKQ